MADLFDVAPAKRSVVAPPASPPIRVAAFSPCRRWRYWLSSVWDASLPLLVVCMLNPSTADEEGNDPTVERIERRARMNGYGGWIVVNLYAARSTDPRMLYRGNDPVGADNDDWISFAAQAALANRGTFLCGWGAHGPKVRPDRPGAVLARLRSLGILPHALSVNSDGTPQHPLYVGYAREPEPYQVAA